jgi:hypothetical protein
MVSEMQKIPEVRYSDRIQEQMLSKHMGAQQDKNNKRTLEGTNLSDQNSFAILNNLDIMRLAARMGIHIDKNHFNTIDIMKDLECARHALEGREKVEVVNPNEGIEQKALDDDVEKLQLKWKEEDSESESFTIV